ncbi:DedA family protein [Actinoallomurus sp. CA-150999]|uniref:DedA family protein n=1 Tax=Actinoallomurus sp. CA-150999 TaxID=3239887 RepID=UPI003D91F1F7
MTTDIVDLARDLMNSPWIHLVLFVVTALDAVLPLVPSEGVVIVVGAHAATGEPNVFAAIGAVTLGAFFGDCVSYGIGRVVGGRLYRRMKTGTRKRAAMDRAAKALEQRGGVILILTRYLPGLRNITTLTAGTVGYPLRPFLFFKALAALTSAPLGILLGYLGGVAGGGNQLMGIGIGLGLAIVISFILEKVRARSRARRPATATGPSDDDRAMTTAKAGVDQGASSTDSPR